MKISYEDLLYLFEHNKDHVDETVFYFDDDPEEAEHYIGYIPEVKGDIEDGCDFKTAKELFEAKVFDGKSIKERWEHVVVFQFGGFGAEDFIEMYGEDILRNRKRVDE